MAIFISKSAFLLATHKSSVPTKPILVSKLAICWNNGNYGNFWQYDEHSFRKVNKFVEVWNLVYVRLYQIGMKFWSHKCLFTALGTINSVKFGHSPVSQKVRGNAVTISTLNFLLFAFGKSSIFCGAYANS